ncbi:K(+)-transporting ATPase subunit F [Mycobacterium sp.]|uniref:K(+)-transporting ATPase subunit F n=1 Tax=Mycobacterium sp. TaxID=1785 RepID=UPI003C724D69
MLPPAKLRATRKDSTERRQDGCLGVHRADGGDLRPARPGSEVGRGTVSYENVVGLVLSVILALFLFAALLFPERF